jgi:hypothetical protein
LRLTWLPEVLRAEGLDVYELPGWKGRGRELASVDALVWHHTATGPRWLDGHVAALLRDGRRDIAGPLSQLGLERDGTWVVIADGRANHNGYGTYGNDTIGVEAYNDGIGELWPGVQIDSYDRGSAAILRHLGLSPARMLGHRETDPARKIDPAGVDMDAARERVAHLITTSPGDTMTPEQAAMLQALAAKVDVIYEQLIGTKDDAGPEALRQLLRATAADADATERRTRPGRG